MDTFDDRVALITGGASGIGLAYAQTLGRLGMHLVLADIEADALDRARATIGPDARSVTTFVTDVSDATSVQTLADATFAAHRTVHLLCNNAGVSVTRSLLTATRADWQWMLGVNVWGVIHGIQSFVPTMIRHSVLVYPSCGCDSPAAQAFLELIRTAQPHEKQDWIAGQVSEMETVLSSLRPPVADIRATIGASELLM